MTKLLREKTSVVFSCLNAKVILSAHNYDKVNHITLSVSKGLPCNHKICPA